jgi:hypothetical protein
MLLVVFYIRFKFAMSFQSPISKCRVTIEGMGTLDGLHYANGVQQFCEILYAHLPKRWTRSVLKACNIQRPFSTNLPSESTLNADNTRLTALGA